MPCTPYTRIPFQCSRHELTDGKQPSHVKRQTKSGVYGCFSLHPSPTPRLCVNSSSPVGVAKHRLILYWKTAVLLLPSTRVQDAREFGLIGRLPYLHFLLLLSAAHTDGIDWKTAVLLLPSTRRARLRCTRRLEYCRIYTSFYLPTLEELQAIGRLPYYYFLLLKPSRRLGTADWNTAVFILPSTRHCPRQVRSGLEDCRTTTSFYCVPIMIEPDQIGRLPYYYFLLLFVRFGKKVTDWKTAVLLLPFTERISYGGSFRLEDCRITTSFYCRCQRNGYPWIGRLPYYYFLLLP